VSDLFLGVIAAAVAVMAVIQVAAMVFALRAARRVGDLVTRLEQDVTPLVANLRVVSAEAARAATAASAQVERAGELIAELTRRVDETAAKLQATIVTPARDVMAVVRGIIAAFAAFRTGTEGAAPRQRPAPAEEEDPLFIG
jgi:alkylated DNA nucleotide flippase Atl1